MGKTPPLGVEVGDVVEQGSLEDCKVVCDQVSNELPDPSKVSKDDDSETD